MVNKNQYRITNNKKLLHKIGKHWVVISAMALAVLGMSYSSVLTTHNVHAAEKTPIASVASSGANTSTKSASQFSGSSAKSENTANVNKLATNMHKNLLRNAGSNTTNSGTSTASTSASSKADTSSISSNSGSSSVSAKTTQASSNAKNNSSVNNSNNNTKKNVGFGATYQGVNANNNSTVKPKQQLSVMLGNSKPVPNKVSDYIRYIDHDTGQVIGIYYKSKKPEAKTKVDGDIGNAMGKWEKYANNLPRLRRHNSYKHGYIALPSDYSITPQTINYWSNFFSDAQWNQMHYGQGQWNIKVVKLTYGKNGNAATNYINFVDSATGKVIGKPAYISNGLKNTSDTDAYKTLQNWPSNYGDLSGETSTIQSYFGLPKGYSISSSTINKYYNMISNIINGTINYGQVQYNIPVTALSKASLASDYVNYVNADGQVIKSVFNNKGYNNTNDNSSNINNFISNFKQDTSDVSDAQFNNDLSSLHSDADLPYGYAITQGTAKKYYNMFSNTPSKYGSTQINIPVEVAPISDTVNFVDKSNNNKVGSKTVQGDIGASEKINLPSGYNLNTRTTYSFNIPDVNKGVSNIQNVVVTKTPTTYINNTVNFMNGNKKVGYSDVSFPENKSITETVKTPQGFTYNNGTSYTFTVNNKNNTVINVPVKEISDGDITSLKKLKPLANLIQPDYMKQKFNTNKGELINLFNTFKDGLNNNESASQQEQAFKSQYATILSNPKLLKYIGVVESLINPNDRKQIKEAYNYAHTDNNVKSAVNDISNALNAKTNTSARQSITKAYKTLLNDQSLNNIKGWQDAIDDFNLTSFLDTYLPTSVPVKKGTVTVHFIQPTISDNADYTYNHVNYKFINKPMTFNDVSDNQDMNDYGSIREFMANNGAQLRQYGYLKSTDVLADPNHFVTSDVGNQNPVSFKNSDSANIYVEVNPKATIGKINVEFVKMGLKNGKVAPVQVLTPNASGLSPSWDSSLHLDGNTVSDEGTIGQAQDTSNTAFEFNTVLTPLMPIGYTASQLLSGDGWNNQYRLASDIIEPNASSLPFIKDASGTKDLKYMPNDKSPLIKVGVYDKSSPRIIVNYYNTDKGNKQIASMSTCGVPGQSFDPTKYENAQYISQNVPNGAKLSMTNTPSGISNSFPTSYGSNGSKVVMKVFLQQTRATDTVNYMYNGHSIGSKTFTGIKGKSDTSLNNLFNNMTSDVNNPDKNSGFPDYSNLDNMPKGYTIATNDLTGIDQRVSSLENSSNYLDFNGNSINIPVTPTVNVAFMTKKHHKVLNHIVVPMPYWTNTYGRYVPQGYSSNINKYTYDKNTNTVNIIVYKVRPTSTITINYVANGKIINTAKFTRKARVPFNINHHLTLPSGYEKTNIDNNINQFGTKDQTITVNMQQIPTPTPIPSDNNFVPSQSNITPSSASASASSATNSAKSASATPSKPVVPKYHHVQRTNLHYPVYYGANVDKVLYHNHKYDINYHSNGVNTINVKKGKRHTNVPVSTNLPVPKPATTNTIRAIDHINFNKPQVVVHSLKNFKKALNNAHAGQVIKYGTTRLAKVAVPGHWRYFMVTKDALAHSLVVGVGRTSKADLNNLLKASHANTFFIKQIVAVHGKKANYVRYEFSYHHHNYWVTGRNDYVPNAYLQRDNFKKSTRKGIHYVKVIRGCRIYSNKRYSNKHFLHNARKGMVLKVAKVINLNAHKNYKQTRLLLTNGTYVTANKNFVKVIK